MKKLVKQAMVCLENNTEFCVENGRFRLFDEKHHFWALIPEDNVEGTIQNLLPDEITKNLSDGAYVCIVRELRRNLKYRRNLEELGEEGQFYLNLRNGVFDFRKGCLITGEEAIELAKKYCFTYFLDFEYTSGADIKNASNFLKFVKTSLDYDDEPDKVKLWFEIEGVTISSLRDARQLFFLIGLTKSGKSVTADLTQKVIYPKSAVTVFSLNQIGGTFNGDLLTSARVNICRELECGRIKKVHLLKGLASEEPVFTEGKFKTGRMSDIHTKLLTCGNQLPNFGELDASGNKAITDRMTVLHFGHTTPDDQIDRDLVNKLFEERNIIFSLALDATVELIRRNYKFTRPKDSEEIMNTYVRESRSLELFIEEKCDFGADFKVHKAPFIAAYKEFCTENAFRPYKDTEVKTYISNCLKTVRDDKFSIGGIYRWGWVGIKIKSKEEINND